MIRFCFIDAQDVADIVLEAESRLGGMLSNRPDRGSKERTPDGKLHGEAPLPPGITKKESHFALNTHIINSV